MPVFFKRVVVVGVGLIGASLGLGLVKRRRVEVIGADRNLENLRIAVRRRAIRRPFRLEKASDLKRLRLTAEDLVILAVPVAAIRDYLKILPRGPLISDVGSTKQKIVKLATARRLRFVGAHPIAGTEESGAEAAQERLFEGRTCCLVPAPGSSAADRRKIETLWKQAGCRLVTLGAREHDRLFSLVSHLPHAAAFGLIHCAAKGAGPRRTAEFALGGLKDTTRIAASSPPMWADIFLDNAGQMRRAFSRFRRELNALESMIRRRDKKRLTRWLGFGQRIRRMFC